MRKWKDNIKMDLEETGISRPINYTIMASGRLC
jgi:hypothetical protein